MQERVEDKKEFDLADYLILSQTIASSLGIEDTRKITDFSKNSEGFEEDGRSVMHYLLLNKGKRRKIPESTLKKYDDNIKTYVDRIRRNQKQNITLKYYQYLAIVFAEVYLDYYFKDPKKFPILINQWNKDRGSTESIARKQLNQKLAYWMATGSGKTILMHINYWQFLYYNKGLNKLDYDNIILVTSDDNMSTQHLKEFRKSGIPAEIFRGTTSGYFSSQKEQVKIISIHKLRLPGEKTGEETMDVSRFGTKNLVFIDEGHKGQKSEDAKWKTVREFLAQEGFIWEYSATFGQTITSKNSPYFNEYRHSILFDYSYRFFHQDGYGKDFHIINLNSTTFRETDIPVLLLANAIDYYEQLAVFRQIPDLRVYGTAKPLWIFVGSRVNTEDSDILTVIQFLNYLLSARKEEVIEKIEEIIVNGNSKIVGTGNKDAFARHYPEKDYIYLRQKIAEGELTPESIYRQLFFEIFHVTNVDSPHLLELYNIKNAVGEIGLKVQNCGDFFGVINIGNKSTFLKSVKEAIPEIALRDDALQRSLFALIDKDKPTINLLLGAKKFIEGWNSYRVSNMCLLNIGKKEGPQIMQLFGRGIRLKGKN